MKTKFSDIFKVKNNIRLCTLLMSILLIGTPVFIYFTGGTKNVYVHLMYIPILLAARNRNRIVVITIALFAAFLVGPFMPVDVPINQMQPTQSWVLRGIIFQIVGLIVYSLNQQLRKDLNASKLVLQSISEGICVIDNEDTIVFSNDLFSSLHHLDETEIVGENVYQFLKKHYSEIEGTKWYKQMVDAIEGKNSIKHLMIPKELNSYGEVVNEYYINVIENKGLKSSVIVVKNIENQLNYERSLLKLSYTDNLTGVMNRRALTRYLDALESDKVTPLGIVFVDIDGTKFINDSFGHQKGDEIILNLSYIMSNAVKKYGTLARYDGDEFVGVIHNASSDLLDTITERIYEEVSRIEVNSLQMAVSCGYSITDSLIDMDEVIKTAENNMYIDKNSSNNSMRNNPIDTIINTLHEKDEYSEQHSKSVAEISTLIAKSLNLPMNEVKEITSAALLHDIGKIIVPLNILQKEGPLTDEEYLKMKEHPAIGYRLLSTMKSLNNIPDLVLCHHERWDGRGYPNSRKANDIPLGARIISVADSFNAMTTNRSYRDKLSNNEALNEIIRCSGTQFDPMVIDVFKRDFSVIIT